VLRDNLLFAFGFSNLLFLQELGQITLREMLIRFILTSLVHFQDIIHFLGLVDKSAILHLLHLVGRELLLPFRLEHQVF